MSQRVVVVGAGLGGLRAAEQLRAADFAGEVIVVGEEQHLPYNRPPLSKNGLAGQLAHEAVAFRRKSSVDDVVWRLGESVVAADLRNRTVALSNGTDLGYDGLVAATGARPRRLPLDAPLAWRHVVRTLDDATRLRADLGPGRQVVVIGSGFIGCEVAATASLLGCEVSLVDPLPVPLQRPLGIEVGSELRRRHEQHGVRFHLGRTVARLDGRHGGGGGPERLVLDDGTELSATVVVEAVGSLPNVEWLADNQLDLSDGVLCDGGLRPLCPDGPVRTAVAIGDIARFPNPMFDEVPRRVEHWNFPTETAKRAAGVLAADLAAEADHGAPRSDPLEALLPFTPMPAFWSDQYDIRLQSFGLPGLADDVRVLEGHLSGECAVGYYRGEVLVGVVLLGLGARYGHYRDLVANTRAASA